MALAATSTITSSTTTTTISFTVYIADAHWLPPAAAAVAPC